MPSQLIEFQLRIRNAADTADVLVITSVRGGTNPYIVDPPRTDGAEFDQITGAYRSGSTTIQVADPITGGTSRLVTSQLEDANFRQQLASRPAYVEYRINGGAWINQQAGIVTGIRLPRSAAYDIDVGDTTMATRNLTAFAPKRNVADATKVEPLATYLARWPNRGCLAGGPVIGGFLGMPDLGGWEMQVQAGPTILGTTVKFLSFVAGYTAPTFNRTTNAADVATDLNNALGDPSYSRQPSTFVDDLAPSSWRDVVIQVGAAYYSPIKIGGYTRDALGTSSALIKDQPFFGSGIYVSDPANALAVSAAIVRVRVFDALPSDRCPIYWRGHPVDLAIALCTEGGLRYDAAAATACKAALGNNLAISLRITSSSAWASFVESVLYGPCGFSARTDAAGAFVWFTTRLVASAAPGIVITNVDVPQDQATLFDLSEPDAITRVTVKQQNLIPTVLGSTAADGRTALPRQAVPTGTTTTPTTRTAVPRTGAPPPDGITVQQVSVERQSGDAGSPVQREQMYSIPGFLDTGSYSYESGLVDAIAREIFDRDGRGRITGELQLLRTGTGGAAVLGQEIVLGLKAMPNHNKRLGDDNTIPGRCVQIIRLTPTPRGATVRVKDSGPNAQPASPLPAITLAVGPTGSTITATITNAATLNAASIGVRLQWALTSGGAPAAGDYTQVAAFAPGGVPTTAIVLPSIPTGLTAYVQGRSEQANHRPSNYSVPTSIASITLGAPSALTATPDAADGSRCALAWAVGTNASHAVVDVYVRKSADPVSADVRRITLDAGSVAYTLDELAQSTNYTASVQHRDPTTGAVSAKTTVAFTTSAVVVTLAAPTSPAGIVGSTDASGVPHSDGTYGLNVTAAVLPGTIEFWEAIETGVGAGTYGTAVLVKTVPAVSGGPTTYRNVAPNDGLRRSLTARHVRGSTTASAYTTAVAVLPWGAVQQPPATTGPSLIVTPTPGPTSESLAWSGIGTITLSIDGGAYGAPPASPIVVTRDYADHTYDFKAVANGQTITKTIPIAAIGGTFSSLSESFVAGSPNKVDLHWAWSGPTATFNLWVNDYARGFTLAAGGLAAGTTVYRYTPLEAILPSGPPTGTIRFYLEPVVSSTIAATSDGFYTPYAT